MPDSGVVASWPTLITVALGASVVGTALGKLLDRSGSRTETVREGYAEATKALNAWGQFPLRIRRRVDDTVDTRARLEALGAQIQENLAYSTGWVGAESAELGAVYSRLVEILRMEVTIHARVAWSSPPADSGGAMNIAGPYREAESTTGVLPAEWLVVQLFASTIQYRVGWRRYLLPRFVLRRRLTQLGIVNRAEEAFATRSARRLSTPHRGAQL